jgi:hypothetical protein
LPISLADTNTDISILVIGECQISVKKLGYGPKYWHIPAFSSQISVSGRTVLVTLAATHWENYKQLIGTLRTISK